MWLYPFPNHRKTQVTQKIGNITFNMVVDSYGINYTGKYNFFHNDHVNKSHSINTKGQQKKRQIKL